MQYSIIYFEETEAEHVKYFNRLLADQIGLFKAMVDVQAGLLRWYMPMFQLFHYTFTDQVVLQTHIKSIYLLYNAHKLTLQGNYGIANGLLRQIFEFQIICKYFHTRKNEAEAEKWLNNRQFNLNKNFMKKLDSPSNENISAFWNSLCEQAHATTVSCQIISDISLNEIQIKGTYGIILMLLCIERYSLECLHHRKNVGNIRKLVGNELFNEFKAYRQELDETTTKIMSVFSEDGKNLIYDCRQEWTFKK